MFAGMNGDGDRYHPCAALRFRGLLLAFCTCGTLNTKNKRFMGNLTYSPFHWHLFIGNIPFASQIMPRETPNSSNEVLAYEGHISLSRISSKTPSAKRTISGTSCHGAMLIQLAAGLLVLQLTFFS